jgi:DNA polymerase-1
MKIVAMDIETDSLDATRIWVVCSQDISTGKKDTFKNLDTDLAEAMRFKHYCHGYDKFVFHNGIGFDVPALNRILGHTINLSSVIDTLIVSRLVDYNIKDGHSLDAWGKRLGLFKGKFKDFEGGLTQEMIDYCENDVAVTVKLFNKFKSVIFDKDWAKSLRMEHDIQIICEEMTDNGFKFDEPKAEEYLGEILSRMEELEAQFQVDFPPKLVEVNRIKYRLKGDGSLYKNVTDALEKYPHTYIDTMGEEHMLVCHDWQEFNAGSTKQRIERLWEAGWEPVDKTKGHILFEREGEDDPERAEKFAYYGWQCNETNLNTLPSDAPQGARALAEWLTLEGRRSSLMEWLGCVAGDGRIHGRFTHIGAWTGRLAHSAPNQANIPAAFHGDPKTDVENVKAKYDGPFRGLWTVEEGNYLVGTDAEGIQLRILADLMESQEYVDAIITGKKEDETDIHNLNRKALGLPHITRDMAKTFIYAFLLGAGTAKVAQILKTDTRQATQAVNNFMDSISGLRRLKTKVIPNIAERGYFRGYDGRKVKVPSEHKTLAGMLQNGESTIMKWATRQWIKDARAEGIKFKLVTWPHDEWQTEVYGGMDVAKRLGEIQRKSIETVGVELGLMCPLAGSTDIGKSWLDTH